MLQTVHPLTEYSTVEDYGELKNARSDIGSGGDLKLKQYPQCSI